MDIDKDFIDDLGIPNNESNPLKAEMIDMDMDIDIDIQDEMTAESKKNIAETAEDAISAMSTNPIINNDTADVTPNETEEPKEKSIKNCDGQHSVANQNIEVLLEMVRKMSDNVTDVVNQVSAIQTDMSKFDGYDKAVDTLKRSLSVHQHNEDNIYKELEGYKKNQYFNYIRPFFEFLINLLTDMIASKKQYEKDREEFVELHGQSVFDEIIDLHNYYTQQIESQLKIQGVEIIEHLANTPFIPTEQLISTPVLTEDSTLTGMVASVDSACYKFEDKVLKKAKVHVYKLKNKI